ncbi:FAD-binding domain-containing protein [Colletotrichum eremochloae]|nr:FAD-binding domain-containing protein [Colletotrichum eremochloae]
MANWFSSLILYCAAVASTVAVQCKVYPTDAAWPSDEAWKSLNERVDNRLLKLRPQAAVCYNGPEYDAAACANLSANWTNSYIHLEDPIEMLSPVHQGLTCVPPNIYDSRNCTMGGFPWYVISATTPKHVQEGVKFAKETGVRLVVKNTGHDFSGKSGGGESLSIWNRYLKDVEYIEEVIDTDEGYSGPAFKCGSGVQAFEIYKVASEYNKVVVGGEGETVGVMGGYIQGGGHSPLSSLYGTGADQALAFEVVTADGELVTADHTQNPDLFWARRGGGGSTFGVATSVTAGVRSYFDSFIRNADNGTYAYFGLLH